MSQIDQAFIQAYAESHPLSPPQDHEVPAPHIVLHPATEVPEDAYGAPGVSDPVDPIPRAPNRMAPEPIPAPYFRAAGELNPTTPMSPPERVSTLPSQPATTSDRRPLSTFSTPQQPAATAFDPVFEVDSFRWPVVIEELLHQHQELLSPVADQLLAAREAGRTMIGIGGTRPGVGCTTVLLCLSQMLSQAGLQVAIVDANFAKGDLASQLGLEFDTGWEDALTGRMPLAETIVKSLHDRMALLPLAGPTAGASELVAGIQTSITAGVMRYHYDIVLFDLGTAALLPQHDAARQIMEHCRLDASLIVADSEHSEAVSSESINGLLELFGPTCHGLIGNHAV